MGSMFRSEPMVLCQIFMPPEVAYSILSDLGEIGCVQFRDLNSGMSLLQRKFVSEIIRCNEVERRIAYIKTELEKQDIKLAKISKDVNITALDPKQMNRLETSLELTENEIVELKQNEDTLKSRYIELTELRQVLENTEDLFAFEDDSFDPAMFRSRGSTGIKQNFRGDLGFVSGIVDRNRIYGLEQMLWRMSHGNVLLKQCDVMESSEDNTQRVVFIVFFQGEELRKRITKVCNGFHARTYKCPNDYFQRKHMIADVRNNLNDLKVVLDKTVGERKMVLNTVQHNLPEWSIMVRKMKAIYYNLNRFKWLSHEFIVGECWMAKADIPIVKEVLVSNSSVLENYINSFLTVIDTKESPPTYNRTNKFTTGFQKLIDAYGIARYQEANPALYSIITFPFLFAVMFGDLGHGLVLFLFGAWMCYYEKDLLNFNGGEIWSIMFGGRYIILMMSIFACYTGAIYNDVFSKSFNTLGTTWRVNYNKSTVLENPFLQLDPKHCIADYLLGIDPIWQLAANRIIFHNSNKMKMSIIVGVVHMVFGLCLNVVNHVYFRNWGSIFTEFLPQLLFLLLLFGYMVFMMFYKWFKYKADTVILAESPGCAPSVLIMFIDMVLFKTTNQFPGCEPYMYQNQHTVQVIFIGIILMCIPWMFFAKPLYIYFKRKYRNHLLDSEEEPMSEILIHQAIHTVEYILSTISHTASYLRLWALSLAHAQLSMVLWTFLFSAGLGMTSWLYGPILAYFSFVSWAFFTVAILILMEGLSAFLHTLRLHWVEFMSKHYKCDGHPFKPFSFKKLLQKEEQ